MKAKKSKSTIDVSVIIPNYNYEKYIEECIRSVVESEFDHSNLEIVVVDDASTDNSVTLVNKIKKQTDIPIHLIKHPLNLGLARARNSGIKNAKGKYLFFLDSDNYIGKDCLKKHFDYLSANENLSACYAPIQQFDNETRELLIVFSNEPYDYNRLSYGNYIDAMSMIKRADLVEIGLYDDKMPLNGWEDYELWLRFGSQNKQIAFMACEPLTFYRIHPDSMISKMDSVKYDLLQVYLNAKYHVHIGNSREPGLKEIPVLDHAITQIFWAGESMQFSELQSVSQNVLFTNPVKRASFTIPENPSNITFLRFDIGKSIGLLNIHEINLKNNKGDIIWFWDKHTILLKNDLLLIENETYWPGKTIQLSFSEDPHFILKVNDVFNNLEEDEFTVEVSLYGLDGYQQDVFKKITTPLSYINKSQITALEQEISELRNEKGNLVLDMGHVKDNLTGLHHENALNKQSVLSLQQTIDQLSANLSNLDRDKELLTGDKILLAEEIKLKNELILRMNSEKEIIDLECRKKEQQLSDISVRIAALESEIHKHEILIAELKTNKKYQAELLTQQIQLTDKLSASLAETESKLQFEQASHSSNKTNLESQVNELRETKNKLEQEAKERTELLGRISSEKESSELRNSELLQIKNSLELNLTKEIEKSAQLSSDLFTRDAQLLTQKGKNEDLKKDLIVKETIWINLKNNQESIIAELNQRIQQYQENFDQKNAFQIGWNRLFKKK